MQGNCFLGLDNGGSTSKCAVFDWHGKILATASARIPMMRDRSGRTERDAELLFQENCRLIREAMASARIAAEDVACISMCGFGGGLGMLDEAGSPVGPFIISTDSRADGLLADFQADGTAQKVYERTFQNLWAGQPAMLLPWLRRHDPALLSRCRHIIMMKDYIRFRLTGVIATEVSDASNTNLFHIAQRRFDPKLFRILGIEELYACAPQQLLSPCEAAGVITPQAAQLTGLRAGTPVATGLYDVAACCLASGILTPDILCLVIGTWSICGHLEPDLSRCDGMGTTLCSFLPDGCFLEESSPTSASNLDWFVEQFYRKLHADDPRNIYEVLNERVSRIDPAQCDLVFLPYLYGSNAVQGAKGCFFNLASHHSADDMLLAIYEGILFSLLYHVERLYPGQRPSKARLSGGASRSDMWCRMLANILGIEVEVTDCTEMGALGSAICASIACGTYRSYDEAVAAMVHIARRYQPVPELFAVYREKYARYKSAIEALEVFQQSNRRYLSCYEQNGIS